MATSVNIAGIGYPSISKVAYDMLFFHLLIDALGTNKSKGCFPHILMSNV